MKEYSFLNVILLVNGVEISGFDEGDDLITVARFKDSISHKVGVDGEMTVSISGDLSGSVVFRLMQSADSNTFLSGIIAAAENGAFVPITFQMKDVKGGDLISATQGYIPKPADMVRGEKPNAQEWMLVGERLDMLHAGA